MNRKPTVVTPERFAKGMTFDQYVRYMATPENLAREGSQGEPRKDFSAFFRRAYETTRLGEPQVEAIRWLAAEPGGPAKILAISEEWSSDCRRDAPAAQAPSTQRFELHSVAFAQLAPKGLVAVVGAQATPQSAEPATKITRLSM